MDIEKMDSRFIHFARRISLPFARVSIFVIFFWFGLLKVLGYSPAEGLVRDLLETTLPFISPESFMIFFGWFEMLIGGLFLIKGLEREVIPLLFVHMATTIMPLFLLQENTWSASLVPTLEGQYIIKNLVIIATAIAIAAHLHPMKSTSKKSTR